MANINCTGCGKQHPRPGGSLCKHLKFNKEPGGSQDSGAAASPISGVDWSAILSTDELKNVPDRSDPSYLGLCEKTISELKQKLEEKNDLEKVRAAEDKISSLMAQLSVKPKTRQNSGAQPSHIAIPRSPGHSPPMLGESGSQWDNQDLGAAIFTRSVVEQGDSKEYLGKLRPESHLVPSKHYEAMNF